MRILSLFFRRVYVTQVFLVSFSSVVLFYCIIVTRWLFVSISWIVFVFGNYLPVLRLFLLFVHFCHLSRTCQSLRWNASSSSKYAAYHRFPEPDVRRAKIVKPETQKQAVKKQQLIPATTLKTRGTRRRGFRLSVCRTRNTLATFFNMTLSYVNKSC